ncbi:hypothetical protein JWG39_01530 [Desulforhopalus vacuolatus]|uniref:hypothetical protein n=1 Tax=Desulforhopalus vacuolatus TaxID=40414 RepID=UPI001963C8EC|nr:hypothetical protein [Desulforhopalus vacuolatus]MBM9518495.1 hypothetical protein [Desulforhopalus vacuolatus]
MKLLLSRESLTPLSLTFAAIFFVWAGWFNYHLDLSFGDSVNYFCKYTATLQFLLERYNTWSSRFFIEALLTSLARHDTLFLVLNTLVMAITPLLLLTLFTTKQIRNHAWVVFALISFYPIGDMGTAGWRATMINYYWPLAAGLFALRLCTTPCGLRWIPLCIALIFACNHEQLCFILCTVFTVNAAVKLHRRQDARPVEWLAALIPLLLCLLSMSVILVSPGNAHRQLISTIEFYPGFLDLPLFYRAFLGFESTCSHYFYAPQQVFLLFAVIFLICALTRWKENHRDILFPLLALLIQPLSQLLPGHTSPEDLITPDTLTSLRLWGHFFFSIVLCLGITRTLFRSFREQTQGLAAAGIFALGMVTRFMLGLSPSIFASSTRTFIFTDFTFILLSLMLISEHNLLENKWAERMSWLFCAAYMTTRFH